MDYNLQGSIIDLIIDREGFKEVTSLCISELNTLIYTIRFDKIIASHHLILVSHYYFTSIFAGKEMLSKTFTFITPCDLKHSLLSSSVSCVSKKPVSVVHQYISFSVEWKTLNEVFLSGATM